MRKLTALSGVVLSAVLPESAGGAVFQMQLCKGANMKDKNSRVIPPGQFGSPFFEPSLSMGGFEPKVIPFGAESNPFFDLDRFFEQGASGGTDFPSALAGVFDSLPHDHRYDRFQLVITDGDPLAGLSGVEVEARSDALARLIADLKPGEQLVCLDYSGAQPPFPGEDAPRVIASRPAEG